ncbi:MAG TPA: alpha-1,4-glucan--maltose-1-phosphate maltosyltransferase [Gammaproteobacteria bacterium]|nr:alpha-1,4-glucan--maltose-1-phosphate maltosyltransferase [Gammaproteobacteria bacterium]
MSNLIKTLLKSIPGHQRVVINNVKPEIECGAFPIKRCIGEQVTVTANIFADGHDQLSARLLFRHESESTWQEQPFQPLGNDLWQASFSVEKIGNYVYTLSAFVDEFLTWQYNLKKKLDADQQTPLDFLSGRELITRAAQHAEKTDQKHLLTYANTLDQASAAIAFDPELSRLVARYARPAFITRYAHELKISVDRALANFGAWYELFPRSCSPTPHQHGTLNDVIKRLAYIKALGFDVIYFPPIHPIGDNKRKGKNNNLNATTTDPGSPWAIGDETGGHREIHPLLGNREDFRKLIKAIHEHGMELALDFALQCSPDHPYLKEHPQWFKQRVDGSLQYAENPPKKYEDIYPLYFQSEAWAELWIECRDILLFWINAGVKIFRVDNPHTKPFIFWQWLIAEIKTLHPDVIFLAEAFTRPTLMYHLAKLGFSQSYTYFTWRNTKEELIAYFTELTTYPVVDFFRGNFWPNTPDILHATLQTGGRAAFITRFILAATLGTNYGIYGPAFELCINEAVKPGSEEYLDSEKYEIKAWDLNHPASIKHIISKVNHIRHAHPALQNMRSLQFHAIDNPKIICYSKYCAASNDLIVVIVNLDNEFIQSGWVDLSYEITEKLPHTFVVHDLLVDATYQWSNKRNYVELNPDKMPAHVLHIPSPFEKGGLGGI